MSRAIDKGEIARFRVKSVFGPYGHGGPKKSVEIIVYDKAKHLRAAASKYNPNADMSNVLGICHPYTRIKVNGKIHHDSAIVRLCKKHCGIGVLTHELSHAVVAIYDFERGNTQLEPGNDEDFAWMIGDFVRQATLHMYKQKVWS